MLMNPMIVPHGKIGSNKDSNHISNKHNKGNTTNVTMARKFTLTQIIRLRAGNSFH
jgi:hypothetical protein